ncbi:MAG: PEP-CTERM sorting domain-containing protein [Verrucomicrobiota bacterium]
MNTSRKLAGLRRALWFVVWTQLPVAACAQNELADATMTSNAGAGGLYNYSIALQNTGPTTIGTFWYAWIPGQFYLPTAPASVTAPAGWTFSIVNPGGGASSILFYANSTINFLQPGSSLTFRFSSLDTPAVLSGDAAAYPGTPIGTSWLYSGQPGSDVGARFVVESVVPEPSSTALLALAAAAVAPRARRRARAVHPRIVG